jgi:formylglycine-generating enzyme required for sulfatase activity
MESNEEKEVVVSLDPITSDISVIADPIDAELYIDGNYVGVANQTIPLIAASQKIEIRKDGYVPYATEFTSRPGLDQAIRVTLKSLEQERLDQIKPLITADTGQELKLFYPSAFTMGASRREAGRRPNENLRDIQLNRPFYLSFYEVTNAEYQQFDSQHSSGTVFGITLNNQNQPVVGVSWSEAALFCNWLSRQEGLQEFYQVDKEEIVGFNPEAVGYRLPTEAEWAWVARTNGSGSSLKYSWGDQLPPPNNAGNFADESVANNLGEIIFNYYDNYTASSPVGMFNPNYHAIYDIAGNVSEWVHDYYGSVGSVGLEVDPLGPEVGQFHVIRGSSWAQAAVTEMRLSFRDFGEEPRDDVGFRIARYLEE